MSDADQEARPTANRKGIELVRLDPATRALRPSHVIGNYCSPEWYASCDLAFREAMERALWAYKAERDGRAA